MIKQYALKGIDITCSFEGKTMFVSFANEVGSMQVYRFHDCGDMLTKNMKLMKWLTKWVPKACDATFARSSHDFTICPPASKVISLCTSTVSQERMEELQVGIRERAITWSGHCANFHDVVCHKATPVLKAGYELVEDGRSFKVVEG